MEARNAIKIARKLEDHLPKDMAVELNKLIAQGESESRDPTKAIIHLLKQNENSLLWFLEQLELQSGQGDETRGFSRLAGDSSAPVSNKWICPKDKTESLPVIQEGEPAPQCDKHKVKMIRENNVKG